jgi:uncharacterized Zn finger protein
MRRMTATGLSISQKDQSFVRECSLRKGRVYVRDDHAEYSAEAVECLWRCMFCGRFAAMIFDRFQLGQYPGFIKLH